jgi:hypothetical protein
MVMVAMVAAVVRSDHEDEFRMQFQRRQWLIRGGTGTTASNRAQARWTSDGRPMAGGITSS